MNIGLREELIIMACSIATEAHKSSTRNPYIIHKPQNLPSQVIFGFAGSWDFADWFSHKPFGEAKINLDLFPSLKTIGSGEAAGVNKAFVHKFELILTSSSLLHEVEKAVTEGKHIMFTGHSSAAPIAIFATLWLLEIKNQRHSNLIPPHCITFGSPLVGDRIFSHALKRECWSRYFTHFVTRYDIVPRILLSPLSSIERELQPVLHYFNPTLPYFASDSVAKTAEASMFFLTIVRNASATANYCASKIMGCTNLILETVTGFLELSPYRPSGRYIFCIGNGKMVIVENPHAVLQLLFYCLQLGSEADLGETAQRSLKDHLIYGNELLYSLRMRNVAYLDRLEDLPLSAEGTGESLAVSAALNDLGLSARARLSLRAAGELKKQRARNQSKINSKKNKIKDLLNLLEGYQANCEIRKVGYYDAFKAQKHDEDFDKNIRRLELAGIWDEIMEMLKRNELPDEFEDRKEWIELGTKYRRLVEPLDIANYYRHLKNEDTGPYMKKGRPTRYRVTQKWREHAEKMEAEPVSESCFWAEVEELCISTCNKEESFEAVMERVLKLERNVSRWTRSGLLGKNVLLSDTTFARWWNGLPEQHKSVSCIKNLMQA